MKQGRLKQGLHPDPQVEGAPQPSTWPPRQQSAWHSQEMQAFRDALRPPHGGTTRAGVLDDLSTYFNLSPSECVQRCINWEQWSVAEWQLTPRDSPEAIKAFYTSVRSWAFDLMWYAYLQAEGHAYPVSVVIARSLRGRGAQMHHLDFGSGAGTTSQLFRRLGYDTSLADISPTLLAFARFRLERRGEAATYLDLNTTGLADAQYDVITAVDTLVHVPFLEDTVRMLHRALKPGGYLFANFDVRVTTDENAWHLYQDDRPLRWQLQRVGFEPEETLNGMVTRYRRVDPAAAIHLARSVRDAVLLRSPLRPLVRRTRRAARAVLATRSQS